MNKAVKSITYQSLIYILLIYLLVTSVVTAIHFLIEIETEKKLLKTELKALTHATNRSITNALWDMNHIQIEAEANALISFPIVKAVKITDNKNITLTQMSSDYICKSCEDSFLVETHIEKELFNKKVYLGKVLLYSNFEVVLNRVKVNFTLILFSALIKSALLVILFIIAFRKYLSTPLESIVTQIDNVDIDNLQKNRIEYESKYANELTVLKNSVNEMLEKIEEQFDSLQENEKILQEKVKQRTKELEQKNKELETLAITDSLTSLFNRRKLDEKLRNELLRAQRIKNDFSVVMLDIDHFKRVNDTYGHQVGDMVLVELAKLLKEVTREIDIVGRWGGEEFLIICPGTDLKGLIKLADSLQEIIQRHAFPTVKEITASLGITVYNYDDDINSIVSRVDKALYKAKVNGRNRVELEY